MLALCGHWQAAGRGHAMIKNGHNPKERDAGDGREARDDDRRGTCAKRIEGGGEIWWCLRKPNHAGRCKGPHESYDLDEPLDPVDEDELGGEGG